MIERVVDSLARSTSATPLTVTVCGVPKSPGVKVSVEGETVAAPVSFEAMLKTVLPIGAPDSVTSNVAEPLSPRLTEPAETWMVGAASSLVMVPVPVIGLPRS